MSTEAFLQYLSTNPVTLKFILQTNRSNYITLSSCEVFAICTLLKVYLEECGPVTVSQVAQSFFSGQDVPLRTFPCARHSLSRPVHWSRTEQQIISIPASLLTACLCLQTHTKQKVEFTANLQDTRSINCIQLYLIVFYCIGFSLWYRTSCSNTL